MNRLPLSPGAWLLLATAGLTVLVFLLPPIAQPPAYHDFADQRACLGLLPNCLDTASNILFVLAGLIGLRFLSSLAARRAFRDAREELPYIVFFLAVILIGIASAYYHLAPDHARLGWDRGAMALAFMAWFAAILGERLDLTLARRLLPLLVAAGLASVAWWLWSETQGRGDLRPYLLMQAAPMLLIPLLLWRTPPRYSRTGDILAVIGLYALALLLDYGDRAVFSASGGVVSGHTLKHAVAALAAYGVVRHLRLRRAL
jgi:hypothetical protein